MASRKFIALDRGHHLFGFAGQGLHRLVGVRPQSAPCRSNKPSRRSFCSWVSSPCRTKMFVSRGLAEISAACRQDSVNCRLDPLHLEDTLSHLRIVVP